MNCIGVLTMSKYTREPSYKDFQEWSHTDECNFKLFYEEFILPLILDLEMDDYFGTEGFDKRFG